MKKWEEQQRLKQYNKKITTAKSSLSKKSPKVAGVERSVKSKSSSNQNLVRSSTSSSKLNDYYLSEKEDLNQIPLYRLLKMYNLQQYAKELISRGYGYDLIKFNYLTMPQLNTLFEEIKVLPGHKTKLLNLIDYINEMLPNISQDFSQDQNQLYYLQSPGSQCNSSYNYNNSNSKSRNNISNTTAVPKSQRSNSQKVNLFHSNSQNQNLTQQANFKKNRPISAKTYSGGPGKNSNKRPQTQNQQYPQKKYGNFSNNQTDNIYQSFKQTQGANYLSDSEISQDYTHNQHLNQNQQEVDDYQKNLEENFNSQYSINQNQNQQQQEYGNNFEFYEDSEYNDQQQQYQQDQEYNEDNFEVDKELQQQLKEIGVDYFDDQNPQDQEYNNDTDNEYQFQENQSFSKTMKNIMEKYQNGTNPNFYEDFKKIPEKEQQEYYEFIQKEASKESNQYHHENFEEFIQDDIQQEQQFNNQFKQQNQYNHQNEENEVEIDKDYDYQQVLNKQKQEEIEIEKQKLLKLKEKQQQIKQQKDKSQQESVVQKVKNNLQRRNSGGSLKDSGSQKNLNIEQNEQQPKNAFKKPQPQKTVQDDIILVPQLDSQNNISTVIKDNKILKNIKNNIIERKTDLNINKVNLEVDKIKNLYLSYDTGKLTSTLVNLDIEEMCFCLGAATLKHIEHGINVKTTIPNSSIAITQSQLADIQEVPENDTEQQQFTENQSIQNSKLSQKNQKKQFTVPQPPIIQEQNLSELSSNPIDEPTMMQDSALDQDIDVKKYMQDTNNDIFKSQLIKNQSQIQDILKESLFFAQKSQMNRQFDGEKELSDASNAFYDNQEQVNSDHEEAKPKNIKKNSLVNYSGNQSLANRLSERDAYDCEMELSDDEINESSEKSKNLVNINQSVSKSDIQNSNSKHSNQNNSQTLEELQLTQSLATKSALLQNNSNNNFDNKSNLLDQSQTQSIEQSKFGKKLEQDEEISMTSQELLDIQRRMQELKNESEMMDLYDSKLDKDLENISYQQCNDNESNIQKSNITNNNMQDSKIQKSLEKSSLNFSMISQFSTVIHNKNTIQSFKQNKKLFDKTFNESNIDPLLSSMPDRSLLQNFCKNIILQSKMEKEVVIIALVYIEKLLIKSQQRLNLKNWRRILFTALIMASKIWDDQSFENENFAEAFTQYTTRQINEFERVFLDFLDYRLQINNQEYAKYYFILRTFAQKNKRSFPLKPLDLQTIIRLQNGSNKAESKLKEMYQNPLNKSF